MATNPLIAAYKRKVAELGALDNEIKNLDMTLPEGEGGKTFDYLAEKRKEIEKDIQGMKEKVEFLNAWERFKQGPWSPELKSELDGLDQILGDIATGDKLGNTTPPGPAPEAEPPAEPPPAEAPESPAEAPMAEPPAEIPAEPPQTPEGTTGVSPEPPPAPAQPMMASKKQNYQIPDKKGSNSPNSERGKIMAKDTKVSMKESIAAVKADKDAIKREAKTRVAAAWTIAKTMLPTAPVEAQKAFAQSLLANKTSALKAALKQTAVNAHYTRLADLGTLKEVHRDEMNDTEKHDKPGDLAAEKSAVKSEVKGEAVNASAKKADDRQDAGPQTPTYNDGRGHGGGTASEPKEVDAGKAAERPGAGERPGDTVNLSEGASKAEGGDGAPKAAAKTATCPNCKGGKMCAKCTAAKAAAAKSKKAYPGPEAAAPAAPAAPPAAPPVEAAPMDAAPVEGEMPPMEGEMPPMEGEGMPPAEGGMPPAEGMGDAAGAGEMVTEEKIKDLGEKAQELVTEIHELEEAVAKEETKGEEVPEGVLETEGEELEQVGETLEGEGQAVEGEGESLEGEGAEQELNLENIFNEDNMEEKTSALANEGDNSGADFFSPSAASTMEAALDNNGIQEFGDVVASMFSRQGADDDPLATLLGQVRTAASVAGMEVLPAFDGSAAKHFEQKETSADSRNNEEDHKDDLWAEVITDAAPEPQEFKENSTGTGPVRTPQDAVPALKEPAPGQTPQSQGKAAAPKAAAKPTLKKIKPVMASDASTPKAINIGDAMFGPNDGIPQD
jgi:hypothetical protein